MTTSLLLLLVYSAGIVALGLWIGRKVRTAEGFFVAGRSLGPGLLFSTMLAANIGGGSTVGATGLGYRDGLAAWWWVGSAAIGSVILAYWIGPAIHRVTVQHNLRTVGDYLEHRYGPSMRLLIGVLLWVGALFILAGQLIGIAWILGVVSGVPKLWGCVIGGVVITTYFAAGGLLTSAWINMVQLAVKLVGLGIALPFALSASGGWASIASLQPTADYWDLLRGGGSGLVYLAMLAPAFVVSPGLLQKVYGARDARAVRIGVGLNALGLFLYAIVPVLLGMLARVNFPNLPARDLALPTLLMEKVPPGIGSLGLAAVFSAEISAADAVLFMLTTSVARDLYARFLRPSADERQQLVVARVTAVLLGAVAIMIAMTAASIIDALSVFYTLMGVGLFVPMLAGLFVPRATTAGALAATIAGIAAVLLVQTVGHPGPAWMTPAMWGLLVSAVAMTVSLALRPPPMRRTA